MKLGGAALAPSRVDPNAVHWRRQQQRCPLADSRDALKVFRTEAIVAILANA